MRDQAVASRPRARRKGVRSASSAGVRRKGSFSVRSVLRLLPMTLYLSVLILAAWLLYYSIASPYFLVREVSVSGNRVLDAEQARDATGALGQNVLRLREDEIERAVATISAVRSAKAVMALPGRLNIEITERTPLVQWQAREGSFLVDRDGVVFSRQQPLTPVPLVKDLDGPPIGEGSHVDPAVLGAVETLAMELPARAGIQPPWFEYSRGSGVAIPVQGGPRVVFGDADNLEGKIGALRAIRRHLEEIKARAEIIDLRFRDRPVYVLASTTPSKPAQAR